MPDENQVSRTSSSETQEHKDGYVWNNSDQVVSGKTPTDEVTFPTITVRKDEKSNLV